VSATELAAWWGAGTGTLVLAWDVFKWFKSGARLRVTAIPNMQFLPSGGGLLNDKKLVAVEVANVGDNKTTLTHIVVMHYKTIFHKTFRRKPIAQFIVVIPISDQIIPYQLGPGERWAGAIDQNEEQEKMMKKGALYVGACHSSSPNPVLVRVRRQ
jgi:hypothetical protein